MKRILLSALFPILLSNSLLGQIEKSYLPYQNASLPVEVRIQDLLARMTQEEKVGQLATLMGWDMYVRTGEEVSISPSLKRAIQEQKIGALWATMRADPWTQKNLNNGLNPALAARATNAIQAYAISQSRLGIPLLLAEEAPHGHMAIGTTVFPTSIGQASTWNPRLIEDMAQAIAREVRLQGGHIGYGPVLDLAREPRWSRVEETYGEDPYLIGSMGEAVVKGFQGKDLRSGTSIAATLKHFVAYGVPEGGHNGASVSIGPRELRRSYLPPFRRAVEAGAYSLMTSYNAIDGVPTTADPILFRNILRKEWGFQGFVVSDLFSINGLVGSHGVASDLKEAASMALLAGVDADLGGSAYSGPLLAGLKEELVPESILNEAVRNILRLKFEMGLFENPYVDPMRADREVHSQEHRLLARQVAKESITLLKNEGQLLPLSKTIKRIAVIGPNADNPYNQLGDYTAVQPAGKVTTVLQGIKNMHGDASVAYVKGVSIRDTSEHSIAQAVAAAKKAEVAIVVLGGSSARDFSIAHEETGAAKVGEISSSRVPDMESGEGFDRMSLDLMGKQLELLQAIHATGTPVVLVLIKGRPLNINWAAEHIPAILDTWYPGEEGGNALAEVLFGAYNPAGRLPISVPRSVGQLPVYYNYLAPAKHGYVDGPASPLYAFGHGLSYSTFTYDDLVISIMSEDGHPRVQVNFTVHNTSNLAGEEVVQVYWRKNGSSIVQPLKSLIRFERALIPAQEARRFSFVLEKSDLALLDSNLQWVLEKGTYELMVGSSSEAIHLNGSFTLK